MHKVVASDLAKLYFTYPNTVAVICVKQGDKVYLMPSVWQIPLSHTPMLFGALVSPKRFTHQKLLEANDFTLNYFNHDHAQLVTNIGSCSGSTIDKVRAFNVQLQDAQTVSSPIMRDAFVSIECKKQSQQTFGDHTLFTGEACKVWFDPQVINDGNLRLDQANPLLYVGNFTYTSIDHQKITPCHAYQS